MALEFLTSASCPSCDAPAVKPHTKYTLQTGEERTVYYCPACDQYFSQTYATPLAGLRTPLSRIQLILDALNDGMGVNAVCRTFHVSKNTLADWAARLAGLKETLLLYALSHRFLQQLVEGDEVYTKVNANVPAPDSEGWTIVLMDRASRFIWELQCGEKDRSLFEQTMQRLVQVIQQTGDLSLVTDGERRYGNVLFELCRQVVRTGQRGRPKTTLPEGVRVRVKNKGSQAHKRGRKRPKYQAPQPEPPLARHASQLGRDRDSGQSCGSLQRFSAPSPGLLSAQDQHLCKKTDALQTRLDVYWLFHNFLRPHFTTKIVPAVALKILDIGLSLAQLFQMRPLNLFEHPT